MRAIEQIKTILWDTSRIPSKSPWGTSWGGACLRKLQYPSCSGPRGTLPGWSLSFYFFTTSFCSLFIADIFPSVIFHFLAAMLTTFSLSTNWKVILSNTCFKSSRLQCKRTFPLMLLSRNVFLYEGSILVETPSTFSRSSNTSSIDSVGSLLSCASGCQVIEKTERNVCQKCVYKFVL